MREVEAAENKRVETKSEREKREFWEKEDERKRRDQAEIGVANVINGGYAPSKKYLRK